MKESPIIFSGEMVKAILEGSKTQTRRIIKHKDGVDDAYRRQLSLQDTGREKDWIIETKLGETLERDYPYGTQGDRLWVRETIDNGRDPKNPQVVTPTYRADGSKVKMELAWYQGISKGKTTSSIYMPRWASRITLEIESIRIERLQEITEEDAIAEGIFVESPSVRHIDFFEYLWDSINFSRGYGWQTNPWVWRIQFRKIA